MRKSLDSSRSQEWRELYLAALFESNKARIPGKIAEAQRTLATRRSELLSSPASDAKEIQALDNALFSLSALRNCLVTASAA